METSKTRHRVQEYIKGNGLDLGCNCDKIKPEAIGIDMAPDPDVNIVGDVTDLYWLKSNSFDFVYSSHTLEDLKDPKDVLLEWFRVIRYDGYMILYLPHRDYYPNIGHPLANKAHQFDYIPDDIIAMLYGIGQTRIIVNKVCAPPNGKYDYENRSNIEYSFLIVAQKI